jgi:phage major head subunit gpT-like protein
MATQSLTGWKDILQPILKGYFLNEYLEIPTQIPEVFDVNSSKKFKEIYLGIAEIGDFTKFNGAINKGNMSEAYSLEIVHDEWTQGIDIQYKLYQDQQYPIFKQGAVGLAMASRRTREQNAFDIFNNAFNTTTVGGDGLALCSSAHTSPVPGTFSTQSNAGSSALSPASYIQTRQLMKRFRTWSGNRVLIEPDTLLVPVELEGTAREILDSDRKALELSNTVNVIKTWKPKLMVNTFIDDINNWFMIDSRAAKLHLHFLNREPLRLWDDSSVSTLVMTFAGYYRTGVGFSDWRWCFGHNCAG